MSSSQAVFPKHFKAELYHERTLLQDDLTTFVPTNSSHSANGLMLLRCYNFVISSDCNIPAKNPSKR